MPRLRHIGRVCRELSRKTRNRFTYYEQLQRNGVLISRASDSKLDRIHDDLSAALAKTGLDIRLGKSSDDHYIKPVSGPALPGGGVAAIKDNFTTYHYPTTCASNILQGFIAPDAGVVVMLAEAGVKIIGKTNMDEFGMGSHSTHSAFGPVKNGEFSAGGSSGGSALMVATDSVDFALGSDTGGSVRLPAAYSSVVGFKPSYGRITRNGLIPYANSLDTVGILARSCHTIEAVYNILDKPDKRDPTCLSMISRERIKSALNNHTYQRMVSADDEFLHWKRRNEKYSWSGRRYRIGVPEEYIIEELHPLVRKAWMDVLTQLAGKGHAIVPISLPTTRQALSAYYVLAPAEASSNLAKYDGVRYGTAPNPEVSDDAGGVLYAQHRSQLFGEEVKRRILLGTFSLSAGVMDNYFIQAQKVRRLVQDDFNQVFRLGHPLQDSKGVEDGVDLIVCPTAPTPPPLLTEVEKVDAVETYMNDVFTVPASLAGLPAISVPYHDNNLPRTKGFAVGIQVIGQYGHDKTVIRFAASNLEPLFDVPKDQTDDLQQGGLVRKYK